MIRMKRGRKLALGSIILLSFIIDFMGPTKIKANTSIGKKQLDTKISSSPSTYVIVTTNAIKSNSNNLTDFIQYKESLGFTVEVITETNYTSAIGQTRVLNIRNWLIKNYETKNIEYVLLIGDPDPDDVGDGGDSVGDVPMLMCYPRRGAGSYEESPTDYIYADLTGDWDTDNDGYHGEYGTFTQDYDVDFEAEVYVGRIPVYSADYSSLDDILVRIINHHNDTGEEKKKILLPMAMSNYYNEDHDDDLPRTDGLDCPEYVWNDITSPNGMSDTVMYETSGLDPVMTGEFHYDMPINKTNFINELNDDYGAVFWWAHGSLNAASRKYWTTDDGDGVPESAEMTWVEFIASTDMGSLENDKPAFFYQSSCLNGMPENSNNLGYALLKQGAAISTVSASRVSWYMAGDWSPVQNNADNTGIGFYYMYYLITSEMTTGKALFTAKDYLGNYWGAECWMNKMDFNLYGDPSMYYWWESPPSSPSPTPISSDSGDSSGGGGDDDVEEFNIANILIISAVLIGAGVGIAVVIVIVVRKKGDLPGRDILPPSLAPSSPTYLSEIPPSQTINEILRIPRFCTKCGAALKVGNKFCTNCGSEIIK